VSNQSLVPSPLGAVTVGGDFEAEDRCPQALEVRGTCSIDVTFHPTAARTSHATLKLSYGSSKQRTVPLTGSGALPLLTLNPASVDFKSQKVGRTSAGITVTLRNPGKIPSTINQIRIDGDFGVDGACARGSTQLSPGETCSLALTFKPSVKGDRRGQLLVQGDGVTASAQLSGVGVAPDPRFDPTALDFGDQVLGVPGKKLLVAVKNAGDASLEGAKIVVTDDFSASGCQQSVLPGAGCEISVTFAPRSRGAHAGTLRLIDDAGNVSGQVPLKGNALAPVVSLSPWPIDFRQSAAPTIEVQVTNAGDAPLIIQTVSISGEDRAYFGPVHRCSDWPMPPGQRCTIYVRYVGAVSVQTTLNRAWLVLTDNAPGSTQLDPIYGPPMPIQ
jgi:HYDIN/CFA65/VesB family protein